MLGQRVRSLSAGVQEAGVHQLFWDGLDENGAALPSGAYVCRMTAGAFVGSRKLLLLR